MNTNEVEDVEVVSVTEPEQKQEVIKTAAAEETKTEEAEMTAHESNVDTESAKTEEADGVEAGVDETAASDTVLDGNSIKVDLSTVELDEEGIPVISRDDINLIKESILYTSNFEVQIEQCRATIKESKTALDEAEQDKIENADKAIVTEADAVINSETATEDEKKSAQAKKAVALAEVESLPKYNEAVKKEYEERISSSINHLAIIQSVARKDIRKLYEDGTVIGIISASSNGAFVQSFANAIRAKFNQAPINEDKEVADARKAAGEYSDVYNQKKYLHDMVSEINEKAEQFLTKREKYIVNGEVSEFVLSNLKITKEELQDWWKKYINVFDFDSSKNALLIQLRKYEQSWKEIGAGISMDTDLSQNTKDEFFDVYSFLSNVQRFGQAVFTTCMILPNSGFTFKDSEGNVYDIETLKNAFDDCDIDAVKAGLAIVYETVSKDYDDLKKKLDEAEDKAEDAYYDLAETYRKAVCKDGFFISVCKYALINSSRDVEGYQYKNALSGKSYYNALANRILGTMKSDSRTKTMGGLAEAYKGVDGISNIITKTITYIMNPASVTDEYTKSVIDPTGFFAKIAESSEVKKFIDELKGSVDEAWTALSKNGYELLTWIFNAICDGTNNKNDGVLGFDAIINTMHKQAKKYEPEAKTAVTTSWNFVASRVIKAGFSSVYVLFENIEKFKADEANKGKEYVPTEAEKESVISNLIRFIFSLRLVAGKNYFRDSLLTVTKYAEYSHDLFNYFNNQFVIDYAALRGINETTTYLESFKKTLTHKNLVTVDYSLQRDCDTTYVAIEYIKTLVIGASKALSAAINGAIAAREHEFNLFKDDYIRAMKIDDAKKQAAAANSKKRVSYKKLKNEKLKKLGKHAEAVNLYKSFIKDPIQKTNDIAIVNDESKKMYYVNVDVVSPSKANVYIYTFNTDEDAVGKLIDASVIDSKKSVNIVDGIKTAFAVSNENISLLNSKYYLSHLENDTTPIAIGKNEFEHNLISTISFVYKNVSGGIELAIKESLKKQMQCEDIDIVLKKNSRLNIRYLKPEVSGGFISKSTLNGNINVFAAGLVTLETFEVTFDIKK